MAATLEQKVLTRSGGEPLLTETKRTSAISSNTPDIHRVFNFYGFDSRASDRGTGVLVPTDKMFCVSNETWKFTCKNKEHKEWKQCIKGVCKRERDGSTRRYAGFQSWTDFYSLFKVWGSADPSSQWRTFYEVILGKTQRHPYFDLDYEGVDEKEAYARLDQVKVAVLTAHPEAGVCLTFESHGVGKFSFHLVYKDVIVASSEHLNVFASKVNALLPPTFIDMKVYSTVQNFRLFGSTKRGKVRIKTLCAADLALYYSDDIVRAFNSVKPSGEVREFMVFRDSLISVISGGKLLDIVVPVSNKPRYAGSDLSNNEMNCIERALPEGYVIRRRSGITVDLTVTDRSTVCMICERTHEHENPFIMVINGRILFYCRRAQSDLGGKAYRTIGYVSLEAGTRSITESPTLPLPSEDAPAYPDLKEWPGRALPCTEGKWVLNHTKIYAIYIGEYKQIKYSELEGKISEAIPTTYMWRGSLHTGIEIKFVKPLRRNITTQFNIEGKAPISIHILQQGSRTFTSSLEDGGTISQGEKKERKKELSRTEIMEKVKDCLRYTEALQLAKDEPVSIGRMYGIVWRDHYEAVATRTLVEFCRTPDEVISKFSSISEANHALAYWKIVRKEQYPVDIKGEEMLFPWQLTYANFLLAVGNKRKIVWIADYHGGPYSAGGGIGKSSFMLYMKTLRRNEVYITAGCPKPRDMATIIENALDSGWTGRILILDLARSSSNWDIYHTLEELCNGYMTSVKYSGKTLIWAAEHIMVMSNWLPQTNTMTGDRWNIIKIEDIPGEHKGHRGMHVTCRDLSLQEAGEERAKLQSLVGGPAQQTEAVLAIKEKIEQKKVADAIEAKRISDQVAKAVSSVPRLPST